MDDLRQLVGKRVVMTGGAANIGRASALLLARHGATVVIGDVDIEGAQGTVDEIIAGGGTALAVRTDVTQEADIAALVAAAVAFMGGLDVGFFNAGIQRSGRVDVFPVGEWDALFNVNPRHCFLMAKYVTPHLKAAGGGSIVLTSSVAAVKGGPGMTGYSASKGAITGFGRALAAELAGDQIRVNILCPGWVDTPFNKPAIDFMGGPAAQESVVAQIVPLGRQAVPEEIAQSVVFLASDMSSYMTGQIVLVDGGVF
ncbi:MAG: SDR family NAD(P)-dependent oxidoreductase [Candidatus Nanopelagicales bacterium]